MMSKLRRLNEKHKIWIKKRGYIYSKPLFFGFFLMAFLGLLVVGFVDGFSDKYFVSCPDYGTPCENPLKELGCLDYCCEIDYLAPGQSCGEPVSWLGRNYNWLIFSLFIVVLLVNHFVFNKGYDFDNYWGDWK